MNPGSPEKSFPAFSGSRYGPYSSDSFIDRPDTKDREQGNYPERDLQDSEQGEYRRGKAGEAQRLPPGEVHPGSIPAYPTLRSLPRILPGGSSRVRVPAWLRMTGSRLPEQGLEGVPPGVNQGRARLLRHAEEGEHREARSREKEEDRKPPGHLIGSRRPGEGVPRPVTVNHPDVSQVRMNYQAPVPGSVRPLKTWCRPAHVALTC